MEKSLWSQTYGADQKPTFEQVESFVYSPYWNEFIAWIEESYNVTPVIEYSKEMSSWNIKYRKSSKSLCTIYPDESSFTVLVVVPPQMEDQAERLLTSLSEKTLGIFRRSRPMAIGRWLMVPVTSRAGLEDVCKLIALRVQPEYTV